MKELKLGGKLNMVALVDDEDYERCSAIRWHPVKSIIRSSGIISTWYAQGSPSSLGFMHRFILGITDPKIKVDHKNRYGLDNQKHNFRIASTGQNNANRPKARKNTSGFKGAYRRGNRWTAAISYNDKLRSLGTFFTVEEAARAYDLAALDQWGEFAHLNFPRNGVPNKAGDSYTA